MSEQSEPTITSASDLLAAYTRGERDFCGANLAYADLRGTDLRSANLMDADLCGANLCGADLRGTDLRSANLMDADLTDADLTDAELTVIRGDIEAVLTCAPAEAPSVLAALEAGRINGSVYNGQDSAGEFCGCLVGTIAHTHGELTGTPWHGDVHDIPGLDLTADISRPAERWFLAIRLGDTPANSQIAAITAEWLREWIAAHSAPPVEV